MTSRTVASLALAGFAFFTEPARAQAPEGQAAGTVGEGENVHTDEREGEEIVVTGRVASGQLRKKEAAYAITTLSDDRLRIEAPQSVADVFRSVPGFWVESSGGEASNNIRVRGIPRDGYSSIGLFEDGLPVQHDPGLGFLNADQSFRFDETYTRVEAVRGGPSSIFASNAPGALVNFITRRGGNRFEAIAKGTLGDFDQYRGDLWLGGPIGEALRFSIGGFYREDDGLRPTQFTANRGGQIRGNLSGEAAGLNFFFDVKHIDDNIAFFLPVPLRLDAGGDIVAVSGFDAREGTFAGRPTDDLLFRSVGGPVPFDLSDGTDLKLTQYTAKFDFDVGAGFRIYNAFRLRTSNTTRNGLFPSTVGRATDRLANVRAGLLAAVPGTTDVQLRYADTGEAFDVTGANGNGLVTDAAINSVSIPLDEIVNDLRITKSLVGFGRHNIAAGVYYSNFNIGFDRYGSNILLEVNENARPLDLVVTGAGGQALFRATERGITRFGSLYNNAGNESDVLALYAQDEWQVTDRLRLEAGARYERLEFSGFVENTRTVNLGAPGTSADDTALAGTGMFAQFARKFDDFGFTLGANYQFNDDAGLFGRYTSTYRLPNATDFLGTAERTDLVKENIDLAEIGLKFTSRFVDLFLTGFYTYFQGVRFTSNEFNPVTGAFTPRVAFADATTFGLEAEGVVRPARFFNVTFNATYQKPEFRNFELTEVVGGQAVQRDFSGNQLLRVPELAIRAIPAVNLLQDRLRAQLSVEYFSERFADAANSVRLPRYTVLNASVRFAITRNLELFAFGDNLTNEIGLTEGNPRAGQFASGDAGAEFFLARPIFGRNFRAAVLVRF